MGRPVSAPIRPRRVSRRRYLARRAGVLAVLLLVVGGLVWGLVTLTGGDSEPVAEGSAPDTTIPPSTSAAPVVTAPPSTAAATTTTAAPVAGPPTAAEPARVLVVGDSDAGTFGPYLKELLDDTGIVETTVDYKVSSGLARPDFFDWPAHLRRELPAAQPDVVVVTFGGNDSQGLADEHGDFDIMDPVLNEDEWLPEYTRRAGEVMDLLAAPGRTVIWVGIPNDDNPEVTERLAVQDRAVRDAVAAHPGVLFVDTWARFSGRDGNWAEYVIDPRDNTGKDVRADDGFHLNENGAEILALDIADLIRADLQSRGATL